MKLKSLSYVNGSAFDNLMPILEDANQTGEVIQTDPSYLQDLISPGSALSQITSGLFILPVSHYMSSGTGFPQSIFGAIKSQRIDTDKKNSSEVLDTDTYFVTIDGKVIYCKDQRDHHKGAIWRSGSERYQVVEDYQSGCGVY